MPHLSHRTIYELYRECLEELSRCGIIEGIMFDVIQVNPDDPQTPLHYVEQPVDRLALPSFDEMILNFQMFPDAAPTQLADIASVSVVSIPSTNIRRLMICRGSAAVRCGACRHCRWSFTATAPAVIFERHWRR